MALESDRRLQTELRSTFQRQEFKELLSGHTEIQRRVEPRKWDVLIRVLEDPRTDLSAFAASASAADDSASEYSSLGGGAAATAAAAGHGGDM